MTQATSPIAELEQAAGKLLPRFAARIIDGILVSILTVALGWGMGSYGIAWLVSGATGVYLYFVLFDALVGSTPGKMLLGLRVIGPAGGNPSFVQALLREAFVLVGAIPYLGGLIALAIWIWFAVRIRNSPTGQGPHDELAGGTRVVRTA